MCRWDPYSATPNFFQVKWARNIGVKIKDVTNEVCEPLLHPDPCSSFHAPSLICLVISRAQIVRPGFSREMAVVSLRKGIYMVNFLMTPKGESPRKKEVVDHHTMTIYDGKLLNNWSTSKIVAFTECDIDDPQKAFRATDHAYLKNYNLFVSSVREVTRN